MDKLPAQFQQAAAGADMGQAEKQMRRMEGIINSMTPLERAKPDLIKATRKRRIAAGAGVQVQDVNRLLNQFEQMQSMMSTHTHAHAGEGDGVEAASAKPRKRSIKK